MDNKLEIHCDISLMKKIIANISEDIPISCKIKVLADNTAALTIEVEK